MQLLKELCCLTGMDEDVLFERWKDVEKKILVFASRESKRTVKSLYEEYTSLNETTAGMSECTNLNLLLRKYLRKGSAFL